MKKQSIEISISKKTYMTIILLGLGVFLVVKAWSLLLAILTAIVIATFVTALSRGFMRLKIPRVVSVILVYVFAIVIIGLVLYLFVPIFYEEIISFKVLLPKDGVIGQAMKLFSSSQTKAVLSQASTKDATNFLLGNKEAISNLWNNGISTILSTSNGVINAVIIFVLSFYFSLEERAIDKFLRVIAPLTHQGYLVDLWARVERKIELWFKGQLLTALITSLLTLIGLLVLDIPYAFLLALIVLVFDLIPFGIIIATVPAGVLAFLNGGLSEALVVVALYVILQQFEDYVMRPFIVHKATGVPSVLILISILVGVQIAGFLGLILGLPAAILIMELIADTQQKRNALQDLAGTA